jgi:hypothetical protein
MNRQGAGKKIRNSEIRSKRTARVGFLLRAADFVRRIVLDALRVP